MVEAFGFICEMNGQSVAAPPTAAAAPVATKRKSRRVGCSAEDAVVTIPNPFIAAAGGTAPRTPRMRSGEAAGARDPRGGRKTAHSRRPGRKKQSRIDLLAPLPKERKPAIGPWCRNARIPRRPADFQHHFPQVQPSRQSHADRTFPARYPAEHRNDSAAVRLPESGGPHHRARRLSNVRSAVPAGRHGLSRPCRAPASRLLVEIRGMAPPGGFSAVAVHDQGGRLLSRSSL